MAKGRNLFTGLPGLLKPAITGHLPADLSAAAAGRTSMQQRARLSTGGGNGEKNVVVDDGYGFPTGKEKHTHSPKPHTHDGVDEVVQRSSIPHNGKDFLKTSDEQHANAESSNVKEKTAQELLRNMFLKNYPDYRPNDMLVLQFGMQHPCYIPVPRKGTRGEQDAVIRNAISSSKDSRIIRGRKSDMEIMLIGSHPYDSDKITLLTTRAKPKDFLSDPMERKEDVKNKIGDAAVTKYLKDGYIPSVLVLGPAENFFPDDQEERTKTKIQKGAVNKFIQEVASRNFVFDGTIVSGDCPEDDIKSKFPKDPKVKEATLECDSSFGGAGDGEVTIVLPKISGAAPSGQIISSEKGGVTEVELNQARKLVRTKEEWPLAAKAGRRIPQDDDRYDMKPLKSEPKAQLPREEILKASRKESIKDRTVGGGVVKLSEVSKLEAQAAAREATQKKIDLIKGEKQGDIKYWDASGIVNRLDKNNSFGKN